MAVSLEIAAALLVVAGVLAFILGVRPTDLQAPEPISPTVHLDQRKAQIYENLRDLQFEFRLGKLSEGDYQLAKQGLQKELAQVLAEIDRVLSSVAAAAVKPAKSAKTVAQPSKIKSTKKFVCPHCGAGFDKTMKFCGECGKAMEQSA